MFNFKPKNVFSRLQRSTQISRTEVKKDSMVSTKVQEQSVDGDRKSKVNTDRNQVDNSINENVNSHVKNNKKLMKHVNKIFKPNDTVYVYWPRASTMFVDGVILSQCSPLTYMVRLVNGGNVLKVHRDSLKQRLPKQCWSSYTFRSETENNTNQSTQRHSLSFLPANQPRMSLTNVPAQQSVTLPQGGSQEANERLRNQLSRQSLRNKPRIDYRKFY